MPLLFLLLCLSSLATLNAETETKERLELLGKIPHSGYSEGLDWHDGYLWHTLPNQIIKIDPKDGSIVERFPPASPYNEAPLWREGKLFVLSYHDNGIYVGILKGKTFQFERKGTTPEIHGWGITSKGKYIVITGDYSSKLYFLDPKTLEVKKTLETDAKDIEDLAWDGSGFWASSFTHYRGSIFRIDPDTGKKSTLYELPDPDSCPIVDGLAYDGKSLWVTGKQCPSIYQVKLPEMRKITSAPPTKKKEK